MGYNLFKKQGKALGLEKMAGVGVTPPPAKPADAVGAATVLQHSGQEDGEAGGARWRGFPAVDPNSATSGMDAVRSMLTTAQDEEKLRRSSVAKQRIMAVADAIRHIGNIANTVKYAPSQQFNSPVMEEQARYEKGKAVRDAANVRYYSYQQAKEAQDQKQRQWEATFNYNAAKDAASARALAEYRGGVLAERARATDLSHALGMRKANDAKALGEAKLKQQTKYQNAMAGIAGRRVADQERRTTAYVNSKAGGGGGKQVPLNTPNGRILPSGGTPNSQQMKQVYYAAKAIDDRNKDANGRYRAGYKPLTSGVAFSWSGSKEDFNMVYDALNRSGELADWTRDHLGW